MSQVELLDLFDQSAGDPELRAAIRAVVVERPLLTPAAEAGPPGLREAAQAVVDDWLTTFGPDGYPSHMPPKLRALRAALEPRL